MQIATVRTETASAGPTALPLNQQERHVLSRLLRLYGTNSISYFALQAGKSHFFSASGKSAISYVLIGRVAVVAGDPIGPEEELLSTIEQFLAFCHEQYWTLVFWQVRDTLVSLYRRAGLHVLKIGEDAIIMTRTFTLTGKAMANLRSKAHRAEKEGLQIVFTRRNVQDVQQRADMERITRTWLASKGGEEMGFSMGYVDFCGDADLLYALAVDPANMVHAFVTFVPIYGRNGCALDLMRRAEQAAPGSMELLLIRSIDYLRSNGADVVSLGLAPLSNVTATKQTFLGASLDFLTRLLGTSSTNRSLFTFKNKFQPHWESRYLVFSNPLALPKIGWALYQAHRQNASLLKILYESLKKRQTSPAA